MGRGSHRLRDGGKRCRVFAIGITKRGKMGGSELVEWGRVGESDTGKQVNT